MHTLHGPSDDATPAAARSGSRNGAVRMNCVDVGVGAGQPTSLLMRTIISLVSK